MGRDLQRARAGLDQQTFELLLAALDPLRERAGQKYEDIRGRLLRFFTYRGARRPEDLADETIDRVSRKLGEGEVIRSPDVGRYFLGVARNVALQAWERERKRGDVELASDMAGPPPEEVAEDEEALACLERCLAAMGPESRDLVLRYYDNEAAGKIARRRALAEAFGLKPGALRLRLHRLRARLEPCIRDCRKTRAGTIPRVRPLQEGGDS